MSFFLYFTFVLFIIVAIFLILLILIQKGRGGGLAGAFGGGGGNTAFGSKTGDVLTWATSILFGVFLLLAIILNLLANAYNARQTASPNRRPRCRPCRRCRPAQPIPPLPPRSRRNNSNTYPANTHPRPP